MNNKRTLSTILKIILPVVILLVVWLSDSEKYLITDLILPDMSLLILRE